jgi:hypothetical protein
MAEDIAENKKKRKKKEQNIIADLSCESPSTMVWDSIKCKRYLTFKCTTLHCSPTVILQYWFNGQQRYDFLNPESVTKECAIHIFETTVSSDAARSLPEEYRSQRVLLN